MRRSIAAAAAAVLSIGGLAFAPSQSSQQATAHTVSFTETGSASVQGGPPGGANVTPFNPLEPQQCDGTPTGYCETVLVEVVQPVADTDADEFEFGTGTFTATLSPQIAASDFDLYAYTSDADGIRGEELTFSAGFPVLDDCGSTGGECVTIDVSTSELSSTSYYLLEVYYFTSAGAYSMEIEYERTDGRNSAGGFGTASVSGDAPAASAERVDVTGGFEPAGDWNGGGDGQEIGSALGQDLEAAYIEYGDDTFTFTIDVTELLAVGGTPEATRYGWSFAYNGNEFELDGKFTNYSRGACDPTAGSCPPVRDPGVGYFSLRGNCAVAEGTNVTLCEELGGVTATFDPADGTIAIPLPAAALAPEGVAACDAITGSASFIGQSVWSASSAFLTMSLFPFDDAMHFVPFVVPHADETRSC